MTDNTLTPLQRGFLSTLLEDLQNTENDEACADGREARDVGTIYTAPLATITAVRRICDAFHGAVEDSSCSMEQLGSDLYLEMAGHGAGFADREHDSDPDTSRDIAARLSAAVEARSSLEVYVGDDGRAYIVGEEA